mgnify:CR=1 FL=1
MGRQWEAYIMCGITAQVGPTDAADTLLTCLENLERSCEAHC